MISAAEVRRHSLIGVGCPWQLFSFCWCACQAVRERKCTILPHLSFTKPLWVFCAGMPLRCLRTRISVRVSLWVCAEGVLGWAEGRGLQGGGDVLAPLTTHACGYTLYLWLFSFLDVSRMCRYSIYLWITLIGSYIQFSKKAESHLHSIIPTYEIYFYQFHHVSTSNFKHSLYILIL